MREERRSNALLRGCRTALVCLRGLLDALVKALALATAAGLLVEPFRAGSAVHAHWLGRGALAGAVAGAFSLTALAYALRGAAQAPLRRGCALGATLAALLLTTRSALAHTDALGSGALEAVGRMPSASLLAALLLGTWVVAHLLGGPALPARRRPWGAGVSLAAGLGILVAAWIGAAGAVSYGVGAPGDAIVVFGSKVHADGRPSGSLLDRTVTACRLWTRGAAPVLVLSGGRAPGAAVSEPQAMRTIALAHGVPDAALLLDEDGVTTAASVDNVAALARARGWRRIFAVSHDYHLARIRLLGDRARVPLRTVPAEETCPAGWKAAACAREVVAWSAAWLP